MDNYRAVHGTMNVAVVLEAACFVKSKTIAVSRVKIIAIRPIARVRSYGVSRIIVVGPSYFGAFFYGNL